MGNHVTFKSSIQHFGSKGLLMPMKTFKGDNGLVPFRISKYSNSRDLVFPITEYYVYEYMWDTKYTIPEPIHSLEKVFEDEPINN